MFGINKLPKDIPKFTWNLMNEKDLVVQSFYFIGKEILLFCIQSE